MESRILQQYGIHQEKTTVFSSPSVWTQSDFASFDESFNQTTARSDAFSSFVTKSESSSTDLTSGSPNRTIKEFCPLQEKEDEKSSPTRFVTVS